MTDTTPKTRTHTHTGGGREERETEPGTQVFILHFLLQMEYVLACFKFWFFQNFNNDSVDMIVYRETMESRGTQDVALL
jgi:hypothetical protein